MVVDLDAVDSNIHAMAAWCRRAGVEIQPHVKTTMAPRIIDRQLSGGATGVTVATVDQAEVMIGLGIGEILIANQVVDADGLSRLAERAYEHPELTMRILVDSITGVSAISDRFGRAPLEVLIDVGTDGGRTGIRTGEALRRLAEFTARQPGVKLVGIAGYEGVVTGGRDPSTLARVDAHCAFAQDAYATVSDLFDTDEPIFSMGGSAYPDRVIQFLPASSDGTRRIVRSGCYVTHDHGLYAAVSGIPDLTPAIVVEAAVLSRPEPGTAVVGAGRRDLPADAGMPVVIGVENASGVWASVPSAEVTRLYDHHAILSGADELAVSDVVSFGISHPCSAFDRWSEFAVTQSGVQPDVWQTQFGRTLTRNDRTGARH